MSEFVEKYAKRAFKDGPKRLYGIGKYIAFSVSYNQFDESCSSIPMDMRRLLEMTAKDVNRWPDYIVAISSPGAWIYFKEIKEDLKKHLL